MPPLLRMQDTFAQPVPGLFTDTPLACSGSGSDPDTCAPSLCDLSKKIRAIKTIVNTQRSGNLALVNIQWG